MNPQLKAAMLAATTSIALIGFAGVGLADPPRDLIDAPKHRHFLKMPDGTMLPVGPQICANADLQDAFNQFHYNIHHSALPGIGHIETLGPQEGAPGLHDAIGPKLVAVPGCG